MFLPNGKTLLKGNIDKEIQVYSYEEGKQPAEQSTIGGSVGAVKLMISNNGIYLGALLSSNISLIWRV
jgi:hypothetical protein